MKARLRTPSPALIISLVALFVALGGTTAYASGLISGRQIVNHSVSAKKLTAAAVNALQGRRGPAGPGAIEVSSFGSDNRANSVRHVLATVHGLILSYACDGDSDQVRFFLNRRDQPGHSVSIDGFYAQDGVVKAANMGLKRDGLAGGTLTVSVTAGVYGISLIDLSGKFFRDPVEAGGGEYCTVSGLITPSAQPQGFGDFSTGPPRDLG